MKGELDLNVLLKSIKPVLQDGEYVFCSVEDLEVIDPNEITMLLKEVEGYSIIVERSAADRMKLPYTYISSWISLTVHSSLEAVGLTAAFSRALADEGISCNVVAGYYHDHIFVSVSQRDRALQVLFRLSEG
jgi:hypothetical protein